MHCAVLNFPWNSCVLKQEMFEAFTLLLSTWRAEHTHEQTETHIHTPSVTDKDFWDWLLIPNRRLKGVMVTVDRAILPLIIPRWLSGTGIRSACTLNYTLGLQKFVNGILWGTSGCDIGVWFRGLWGCSVLFIRMISQIWSSFSVTEQPFESRLVHCYSQSVDVVSKSLRSWDTVREALFRVKNHRWDHKAKVLWLQLLTLLSLLCSHLTRANEISRQTQGAGLPRLLASVLHVRDDLCCQTMSQQHICLRK